MTKQEILTRVTPIFQEVFNDEELEVKMELTSDDIDEWSSISLALLVTYMEKEFNIKFKLLEVAQMNDVATIISIIDSKFH